MADRTQYGENDPRHHTAKLKQMLRDVAAHAREDVGKVSDPKAQALFETTAEVLLGLERLTRISKTEMSKLGRVPQADIALKQCARTGAKIG